MQVLVFIGEAYYPKNHFEDLAYTLPEMPTLSELAQMAARKQSGVSTDSGATTVNWLDVLIVDGTNPPQQRYFTLCTEASKEAVLKRGWKHPWMNSYGSWQGIGELVRVSDGNFVDYKRKID